MEVMVCGAGCLASQWIKRNMAIGYSTSGTTQQPSIRYAGRRASDPLSNLGQGEANDHRWRPPNTLQRTLGRLQHADHRPCR